MNFDRVTNPHPTDFSYEIRIRSMRILAGSVTSLIMAIRILSRSEQFSDETLISVV